MKKNKLWRLSLSLMLAGMLMGCYQMNSDDDLRTVPVTNNPNIVPAGPPGLLPSAPM